MHVLITGGYGCIGSWIAKNFLERGDRLWIYDLKEDPRRLRVIRCIFLVGRNMTVRGTHL